MLLGDVVVNQLCRETIEGNSRTLWVKIGRSLLCLHVAGCGLGTRIRLCALKISRLELRLHCCDNM
jgi:hypothetical protein